MNDFSALRSRIRNIMFGLGTVSACTVLQWSCTGSSGTPDPFASRQSLAAAQPSSLASQLPSAASTSWDAWRDSMAQVALPKAGCFKASYPSTAWQPVACTTAPKRVYPPAPQTVGSGQDFSLSAQSPLSSVTGKFDSVTGVTTEISSGNFNSYSLQLNSDFFTTPVCPMDLPGCYGWQQFIFSNTGGAFIQSWLVSFGPNCPLGWDHPHGFPSDCIINSQEVPAEVHPIQDLGLLSLTGESTADGMDAVKFSAHGGALFAMGQPSLLGLHAGPWKVAEFNIFGDGNSSQAIFNDGSTVVVRVIGNQGTALLPSCVDEGFTAETNSLTLLPPCCPTDSPSSIVFTESNVAGAASQCACPAGMVWSTRSLACVQACAPGQVSVNGQCQACGQPGQACCADQQCGNGSGCALDTSTCVTCGTVQCTGVSKTFHLGANCLGSLRQETVEPPSGACDLHCKLADCAVSVISQPNGSFGTAIPQSLDDGRSCECDVSMQTPSDCTKWADFQVSVTEVPDVLGCP